MKLKLNPDDMNATILSIRFFVKKHNHYSDLKFQKKPIHAEALKNLYCGGNPVLFTLWLFFQIISKVVEVVAKELLNSDFQISFWIFNTMALCLGIIVLNKDKVCIFSDSSRIDLITFTPRYSHRAFDLQGGYH